MKGVGDFQERLEQGQKERQPEVLQERREGGRRDHGRSKTASVDGSDGVRCGAYW